MNRKYYYDLFVQKLKEYFNKEISAGYEFDDTEDTYKIWHNYRDFDDIEFKKALGKCIKEVFYANKIFDYYITYEKRYELLLVNCPLDIPYGYVSMKMKREEFILPTYLLNQEVKYNFLFIDEVIKPTSQNIIPSKYMEASNIYWEGDFAA